MLYYTIIKQQNTLGEGKEDMYYPRLTGRQQITLEDIAEIISERSSLTRTDITATLVSLEDIIPEMLIRGYTVKLGDLGTFSLHAKVETSPERSLVTWRSFKKMITRFRPGKALKIRLSDVKFKRVGS